MSDAPGELAHLDVGIVAGETSGDILGAGLVESLRKRVPNLTVRGIAGPRMQALGAQSWHDMDRISVMGLEGLAKGLPEILGIRKNLITRLTGNPPDVFVGIDVPDFNLGLEYRLRRAGIPTVHYVSPTVWAWRGYRIKKIKKAVSHMLTLFPFEADYYVDHGVPVTFVGHPMADDIDGSEDGSTLRNELGLKAEDTVVAMLPGSRSSEVQRLTVDLLETAKLLSATQPDLQYVVPFASNNLREQFMTLGRDAGYGPELETLHVVDGRAREAMAASNVVLLASGTATLEAALIGKPMVVTYKVSAATALMVRTFSHTDLYAMPNHLLSKPSIPELIQENATPQNLAAAVRKWLDEPEAMRTIEKEFSQIHATLRRDASERAADAIVDVVTARRSGSPS